MDRNFDAMEIVIIVVVALRKESVDRNNLFANPGSTTLTSLSARRAWIEMFLSMGLDGRFKSLSARRAWIEMIMETPWRYLI